MKDEGSMASSEQAPPIRLEGVTYNIDGRPVLAGVDLEVHPREIVAVMGRSGCGKTTLLRLVMGLIPPASGGIELFGQKIVGMPERTLDALRLRMGMVFQGAALFDSLTVAENVAFGLREHRRLPESEMARVVTEKLYLVGLEGTEGLMPAELSGGMQKRVGIARALAMDPEVVLYDEPTAGLDPIAGAETDELIVSLRECLGVASLVVTHDVPSILRIADRAAMLRGGRVVAVGSPAALRAADDPTVHQFFAGITQEPLPARAEACERPGLQSRREETP
jgi:phospholipid/cholesterol/gamma-HCH transport system ATP-binding protein